MHFPVLEEAFNLCDHDKNGTICSSEIGLVLRALGFNPTEREVKDIVDEIDKNSKYKKFETCVGKVDNGSGLSIILMCVSSD